MQNHFELFGLIPAFVLDMVALDTAYRQVQSRVHPDKFANSSDTEKRVAMQWATRANEAYQTLKNPLRRASYLCELNGVDLQTESNTAMPAAFLMRQMEWREALEEARTTRNEKALAGLEKEVRQSKKVTLDQVGALIDQSKDFATAGKQVRELMFVEKFAVEVGDTIAMIEDA